jgi:hypothetical protein
MVKHSDLTEWKANSTKAPVGHRIQDLISGPKKSNWYYDVVYKSAGQVINKVTRVPETRLQAPVTPSERHLERNQKVPGWPGS